MKIKSKRHPDRQHVRHVTMSIMYFRDMKPIDPADFLPMPPPISAVELQETVDAVKRDIIAFQQLNEKLSAERVKQMVEVMTAQLVVPTPNILK